MATFNILTDTYFDDTVGRTGADVFNVNNTTKPKVTVRTDTRFCAGAPAGGVGSLGNVTLTEGSMVIDGTKVRELPFDTGTGTVPAIGTSITQAGVTSSYLLGVYANRTSAPVSAGGAMPTSGFIKFREVDGDFVAGALTGIGANATGVDVVGWIEVVGITNQTTTNPRLGSFTSKGNPDRYLLGETDGTVGQQFQVPTNGAGESMVATVYIENDDSGLDKYNVVNATNVWDYKYLGTPVGATDAERHSVAKYVSGGKIQLGEIVGKTGLSYTMPVISATYAVYSLSDAWYRWEDDILEVEFLDGTGSFAWIVGNQYYLDMVSGSAVDGTYELIERVNWNTLRFSAPGSGLGGTLTMRIGWRITSNAHGLDGFETVYVDFTSGSETADGEYIAYFYDANSFIVTPSAGIPSTTGGNCNIQYYTEVTETAHGRPIASLLDLNFTSGAGTNGTYPIWYSNTANTNIWRVSMHNNGTATSGLVDIAQQIGHVPEAGKKVYINNILLRQTANATSTTNIVGATYAERPEFDTQAGGEIDIEYTDSTWYINLLQSYKVNFKNNSYLGIASIAETSTEVYFDGNSNGENTAVATATSPSSFVFNIAGGTINDNKLIRFTTTTSNSVINQIAYCNNFEIKRNVVGHYSLNSGLSYGLYIIGGSNNDVSDNIGIQASTILINVNGGTYKDFKYIDRLIGYTHNINNGYLINIQNSSNITIDGITRGDYENVGGVYIGYVLNSKNILFKNIGTEAVPLDFGTSFKSRAYSLATVIQSGGYNENVKIQRSYIKSKGRSNQVLGVMNQDVNFTLQNVTVEGNGIYAIYDAFNQDISSLRCDAQASISRNQTLGSHFLSYFKDDNTGVIQFVANEPSTETESQYTVVAGTPKFAGNGYIYMKTEGDEITFEDSVFRKGFTGFRKIQPYLHGYDQTSGRINFWYSLDKGNGWEAERKLWVRGTGAMTNGAYTAVMSDLDGATISVGDTCLSYAGTHRAIRTVTDVSGSTITFDLPNPETSGGRYMFFMSYLDEVIDPAVGVKVKIRAKTRITNTGSVFANIFIPMKTTAEAQASLYPETTKDVIYTLTNLDIGTQVKINHEGTTYLYASTDGTISHEYEWNSDDGDIPATVLIWKNDKKPIKLNVDLTENDTSTPILQVEDLIYTATYDDNYVINFTDEKIEMTANEYDVPEAYSKWKDEILIDDNLLYDFAFDTVGGDVIAAGISIPYYSFLINGWKVTPIEGTTTVTSGIIVDATGEPFDTITGNSRINYQQPVQALQVSTGSGLSPEQEILLEDSAEFSRISAQNTTP